MTETVDGVRDPLRVSPDHENAVIKSSLLLRGHDDIVCPVDDDGIVRWPDGWPDAGDPVWWGGYTVLDTDVDPETWGDHYHHPDDCDSADRKGWRRRHYCESCTFAADRSGGDSS